ncbi:S-layer homology domain-containing protein [Ammoniphilus sp. CFH 90114]|uniref:S-layer homology domain-containing protein n=1 Tax=Ammoniphilus sp. CFH 90114 TaxID=2493665 RepID=UPI00100F1A5B|nr:S-layer homology domain-containing protein [Ammoniphilus sp. CFH 90114]RXT05804.1 hypothetical protein EIZ39_17015 [Ammoniphilus sp. CFH 90114]
MKRYVKNSTILPIALAASLTFGSVSSLPEPFTQLAAADNPVSLRVNPATTGDTFTVDVVVKANDLYAAKVNLDFDSTKVEVVDAMTDVPGVQVKKGNYGGGAEIQNNVDNQQGRVGFSALLALGDVAGINLNDTLYTATFKVKQAGDHGIKLGEVQLANSNNQDISGGTPQQPGTGGTPGTSGPGGGGPTAQQPVVTQPATGLPKIELKAEDVQKGVKDGKLSIQLTDSKGTILLPSNIGELLKTNKLEVKGAGLTMTVPQDVLVALTSLVSQEALQDSRISISVTTLSAESGKQFLAKAKSKGKVDLIAGGDILDFDLSIVTQDGKTSTLKQFNKPVTIALRTNAEVNAKYAGIYFLGDNGELEYMGGTLSNGMMTAEIHHFSKFAVLEYKKSYDDVAVSFWASNVIQELAAKHIVSGVSETQFAPGRSVTRAEFSALLVRALGLKAKNSAAFKDVPSSKWYAKEVTAAAEAGIVKGKGNGLFAPEATITRQEMVAMLVKAYEVKTGQSYQAGTAASFSDMGQVQSWAKDAVSAAVELDLVKGRTADQFSPQGKTTRAESAQVIYNLLNK